MKENKSYSLLIIGDICNNHTIRFIRNLAAVNPKVTIDVFSHRIDKQIDTDVKKIIRNLYTIDKTPGFIYRIPVLHSIVVIFSIMIKFIELSVNKYDVVNIHFPLYYYRFILKSLRKITTTILVTPWGSDVYRVKGLKLALVKKVYDEADFICGAGNRFNDDVKKIFNVPKNKFVHLDIGSDTIDYIIEHNKVCSREEAKFELGLVGKYVIAGGYNAAPAQNHMAIINAINETKSQLPQNTILLLPMTYLGTTEYREQIKFKLDECGIDYQIFDSFLSLDVLYKIRRATDLFIHIQSTDANCASLQEFILCGCKVINGSWLRYKELEIDGNLPYALVDSPDKLSQSILDVITNDQLKISPETIDYIESYGWKSWIIKWDAFFTRIK